MEDLPALCGAMLERIGRDSGHSYRLTGDALRYLSGYQFPGNIRELRNILQVVVAHGLHSTGGTITWDRIEHCMRMRNEFESLQTTGAGGCDTPGFEHRELVNYGVPIDTRALQGASPHDLAASPPPESPQAPPTLQDVEARHIAELLRRHGGNRKRVAAALGISERTLYRKLKRYDLKDVR
jgi:transcriptional regulator with PAS, ATPase and Fis domain